MDPQAKAADLKANLAQRRLILHADQLVSLVAPRARLEQEFPGGAYFFTIDGVLNGAKITGAMFAGECILVHAPSREKAQELANSGLRSTIELLHREYETRALRGETGLAHDIAGRRGRPGDDLRKLPKLKAIMEHVIGGLPWRW